MEKFDGRHVCVSDLINYLKRDEYLDGYTEPEQLQVRANIGAVSREDLDNLVLEFQHLYIADTYEGIAKLVENNELKTGYRYAITNFSSTYLLDTPKISENIYTVILTAISSNKFDPRVVLLSDKYTDSYKWKVEYDFTSKNIQGTLTKGEITFMQDTNNNSAYYDFKSIKFRRTKDELKKLGIIIEPEYLDLYTFNTSDFREASNTYNITNNQFEMDCYNNVFIANSCQNNVFKAGFKNNTFTSICQNNYFMFNTQNNNFKDAVLYVSGSVRNKDFIDINYTTNLVSKQLIKTNEGYAIQYLDPDTLTAQVQIL